jgi:uncharacterized membrane protein YbjE (DUF340 family)
MWLVLVVIVGIFCGRILSLEMPKDLSMAVLTVLIFFAGMNASSEEEALLKIAKNIHIIIILAVMTVLGTFLGAVIISFFIPLTIKETILATSGLGWYSLSGIMLTNLYSPYLGSIAFVSNVLRESFAILLVPWVAKFSKYGAVSVGGATSMDTLLGVITKSTDAETSLVAFGHGVLLTTLIPFLIPLLLYFFSK